MNMETDIICISCPLGCTLHATLVDGVVRVEGNQCKRGQAYAEAELTDPRRTLTTSVWVEGGDMPLVSVRSRVPMPKHMLGETLALLRAMKLQAPVNIGDVILENASGSGVDIIATRNVK